MDLTKYPVTTPFGYVPGYPLNNGFHNGIDYGVPMNTPLIINGVEVARTNNTGASTGPHLHVGKYQNGAAQNPGVGAGTRFDHAVVFDVGRDAVNGTFVRVNADGALWNYLHLADGSVKVTAGQVLQGGSDMSRDSITAEENDLLGWFATGIPGNSHPVFKNNIGNSLLAAEKNYQGYQETKDLHLRAEAFPQLQAEIADLKKQLGQKPGGGYNDADRAQAAETNNLVKQIWQKLTSIFK